MDSPSLDEMLNGAEPEAEAAPEVVEAPTNEGPVRDDKGRFAPKGETEPQPEVVAEESAPPAPSDTKAPVVPRAALEDERRKRQELEQRLQQLEQLRQNPPAPPPSIWEDEQGWQQNFGQEVVGAAVTQATLNARLDMSEMMVRQANPDFEAKKAEFIQLMNEVPGLQQQALSDPHPWNFAYDYVTKHNRMKELQAVDLNDLTTKLREQIRAELQAEAETALKTIPASLPPSLATERNVGSRSGPAWSGPRPIDDILSR